MTPGALAAADDHSGRADLPRGRRPTPSDCRAFSCDAVRPPSVVRLCCMAGAGERASRGFGKTKTAKRSSRKVVDRDKGGALKRAHSRLL